MFWRYFRSIPMTWVGMGFLAPGIAVFFAAAALTRSGDLKGSERWILPLAIFGLGAFFFVAGAIILVRALIELHRRISALRDGSPVDGRVGSITVSAVTVNNRSYLHVNWNWRAGDGAKGEGKTPPLSPEHAKRWQPGDRIAAFRHPSIPSFAEADVYGFRSVVPAPRPGGFPGPVRQ